MLLPIPLGYFVSVFLLISGVLNCMEYLAHKPANCTRAVLLNGLAEAGWPIIVAAALLLLIQLNRQLEKLRLNATADSSFPNLPETTIKRKKIVRHDAAETPAATPAPVNLAKLVHPATPQQPASVPHAAATPQRYPNSPIPGGGRVPQQPAAQPDLPPRPDSGNPPRDARRAPSKAEAENLNYFKVD